MKTILVSTNLKWLWPALLILGIDLISKQWVIYHLPFGKPIPITSYINFTYIYNSGVAFGLLASQKESVRWMLSVITVITQIFLLKIIFCTKRQNNIARTSYAMIISGSLGNLLDRLIRGAVVDFIDCHISNWHWPIFNVADIGICIGVALVLFTNELRSV